MSKAIFRFWAIAGLVLGSVAALSAQSRVVSKYGAARVQGRDVIVHVWVVVPSGLDGNEVALAALREQGARPFQGDEFSPTGLVWDEFSDADPLNNFVTQNYNSADDPTGGAGELALMTTQDTWTAVSDSTFAFSYDTTDRCPSLVRECQGPQVFDGFNDVAWLELRGCCTLGVTWFGISMDEADMALNTKFNWTNDYDPETVFLHENGHVVGLGHSNVVGAVMEAYYGGERRELHDDDIAGITALYPAGCVISSPDEIGLCSDGIDNDCDGPQDCDDLADCPSCGDGVADCLEFCDGADLGGVTCEDLTGFSSGDLACDGAASCGAFDTGGCIACEGAETSCDDSIDNDCDGLTDCDDIACDFDLACLDDGCINPSGLGAGETCTTDGDCCLDKCRGGGPQGKSCKE